MIPVRSGSLGVALLDVARRRVNDRRASQLTADRRFQRDRYHHSQIGNVITHGRWRWIPPWQMYVSSTLQEPLVGFNSRRHLLFS
jgi:hypothetical protein